MCKEGGRLLSDVFSPMGVDPPARLQLGLGSALGHVRYARD
jgi:hypothetical protein